MRNIDLSSATQLGAATLHEAAGRIGALPATIRPVAVEMRAAGPAFTIASPPGDNVWIHRGVYAASPGDVLVVATGDRMAEWGYFGEVLAVAALARGLAAVVLEGGCRDTGALETVGIPIFSLGPCIRGTTKNGTSDQGGLKMSVKIGDVVISPGDLIVGDRDGLVALPMDRASDVIREGVKRVEKEKGYLDQLRKGGTTLELYNLG